MNTQLPRHSVSRASLLAGFTIFIFAVIASASSADTLQFDFHGRDSSAAAAGEIDATFEFTGEKQGSTIAVDAVQVMVIDGASTATNLFAALSLYQLKAGSSSIPFPVSGVTTQPTIFTITNGRDTNLPGNVWKLDINGKNASLRTHGDAMDVVFKGTLTPKVNVADVSDSKTMYMVWGIVGVASVGTGIYLLSESRKQKERRRRRRRSLLVEPTDENLGKR